MNVTYGQRSNLNERRPVMIIEYNDVNRGDGMYPSDPKAPYLRPRRRWPVPVLVALGIVSLTVATYVSAIRHQGQPVTSPAEFLADGATPVAGHTYQLDLSVHCDVSADGFGGQNWKVKTPRPDFPGRAPDASGRISHESSIHGFATVDGAGNLIFEADPASLRGEWELTFNPLPVDYSTSSCPLERRSTRSIQIVP